MQSVLNFYFMANIKISEFLAFFFLYVTHIKGIKTNLNGLSKSK